MVPWLFYLWTEVARYLWIHKSTGPWFHEVLKIFFSFEIIPVGNITGQYSYLVFLNSIFMKFESLL